jgi:hypothetical protein
MDLEGWLRWAASNWLAVLEVAATIFFGVLATVLGYLQIRKSRWRKYRCRCLPYDRIFRGKEYGYDPKTFLTNVGSLENNFKTLQDWHAGKTKPLLIRGAIGAGKSRLASEFLGQLSLRERVRTRILMPTVNDMREKMPPRLLNGCILFLNDLHEFRGAVDDSKLIQLLLEDKTKIVATIPDEAYDASWAVLQSHYWQEMKVEQWTEREGRRLAEIKKIRFDATDFTGTPLSVIAPAAEIKRQFDSLPRDRKAVLEALKVIKMHLGCFATCELASALTVPSGNFDQYAFTDIVALRKIWCKTDGSAAMLADGMDNFVRYDVSTQDAYGLQVVLTRAQRPVTGREKYLFYLGNRFAQLGDYDGALECYDQSKDLNSLVPTLWLNRALTLQNLGRIGEAVGSYHQAKVLFEKRGNQVGMGAVVFQLGTIEQHRRNYPDAIELFNESLKIWQTVNNDYGRAIVLHHLGMIEQAKRNYPGARSFYSLSLGIKQKLGARSEMAVTLFNLARIELNEGDLDKAKLLCSESLDILKESGDSEGIANALHLLYEIEYWKGNYVETKKLYDQSLEIKRKLRDQPRPTHRRRTPNQ